MLLVHPLFSPAPLALALALALVTPGMTQAQPTVGGTHAVALSIAAQPLASALNELSTMTGTAIGFAPALVDGKMARAVSGELTARQAVDQILSGSGLIAVQEGSGLVIKPIVGDGVTALAPVMVRADMSGTTEGSDSYTATGPSTTATKLGLTLRETPQSVTVVTRQKMDDKAYQTLDQAIADTPGMTVSNGLGSTRYSYYARGLEVDSIQYDGMSTHINSYTRDADPADDLDLYDRVEVLRGAAGLTAGAGNPSGAINLIRKRPLDVSRTLLETSVSSFGSGKILIDTSQPLNASGTVRGRLIGSFLGGDSYIDYTSSKTGTFYGVIDADLGEHTNLSVGYAYKHEKLDGYDWTGLVVRPDGSFFDFDASTFLGNASDYAHRRQHTAYLDLEHRFDSGWRLRSAGRASWSDTDMETGIRSYWNGYTRGSRQFEYKNDVYSLDINLSGPVTLFGRSHDVVLGFNGARSDITGLTLNPNLSLPFDPENWDPSTPWPTANYTPSSESDSVNKQYGVYLQTRLNVTDAFKVFVGGRVSWYSNSDSWFYPRSGQVSVTDMKETAQLVPYLGGVYDLTERTAVYASYTSIFRPQSSSYGVNGPLSPVKGTNVELGIKQDFFDGRLTGSLAVFETNRDNVASGIPGLIICGPAGVAACYESVDGIRTRGIEIEAAGELTERWRVAGSYTYAQSERTEGAQAGERFSTYTYPEQIFKLFATYTFPDKRLTIGGGVRAQSKLVLS